MLTSSPQILKKIQSYRERDFISYNVDEQMIGLNTDTADAWVNDDEFFRNILFSGPDLNSPVTFLLRGKRMDEIGFVLESRIIPNMTLYLAKLGYTPDLYCQYYYEAIQQEVVVDNNKAVDEEIVKTLSEEPLSTPQPKTTKKRK